MKTIKKIGVLGGIGPLAGANLLYSLINLAQQKYGAVQDHEFPQLFLSSATITDFDETGFTNPKNFLTQLIHELKKLEQADSDFIIIACNTVHHHFDELQSSLKIPILNLIEKTVETIKNDSIKVAGILSSESTNHLGLYTKELQKNGIKPISATPNQQQILNQIILNVMGGTHTKADSTHMNQIIAEMQKQGAEGIIIGCTELPLAFNPHPNETPQTLTIYDSNQILAEAALKEAYGET